MRLKRPSPHARVELLPLMDIAFLLLVFFVYSMFFLTAQRGLTVALPDSEAAEPTAESVLALTIDASNRLYLGKEPVTLSDLTNILIGKKIEPRNNDPSLYIFAAENVPYGELYKVLDAVKLANIKKISLQAKSK